MGIGDHMNAAEIPDLAIAINRWLSYQRLCGREALLSEAYLGHPLAEYLIHRHPGEFRTEIDHPVLNSPGPGRPKQIDYALLDPETKIIESAIECKWISKKPYDKQRILNDILRLECVKVKDSYVKRYFVVAGLREHFDNNFKNLKVNASGGRESFTRNLLSFSRKNPEKLVSVISSTKRFHQFYIDFQKEFKSPLPNRFKTKFIGYRTADDISVGIWRIVSFRNRSSFSTAAKWRND